MVASALLLSAFGFGCSSSRQQTRTPPFNACALNPVSAPKPGLSEADYQAITNLLNETAFCDRPRSWVYVARIDRNGPSHSELDFFGIKWAEKKATLNSTAGNKLLPMDGLDLPRTGSKPDTGWKFHLWLVRAISSEEAEAFAWKRRDDCASRPIHCHYRVMRERGEWRVLERQETEGFYS